MNIYAASLSETQNEILDLSTKYGKQLIWIGLSFVLITTILLIDTKTYEKYASIAYGISIVSLALLFVIGKKINGATSWYGFGSFRLQPTEFAKFATVLAVSKLLNDRQYDLKKLSNQLKALFIVFLPAVLISLQPDPGSGLVYTAFFFVLYREGLPIYYIAVGIASIVLFMLTLEFESLSALIISDNDIPFLESLVNKPGVFPSEFEFCEIWLVEQDDIKIINFLRASVSPRWRIEK